MSAYIGASIEVPANASRFFKESFQAVSAPTGIIELAIQDGLILFGVLIKI